MRTLAGVVGAAVAIALVWGFVASSKPAPARSNAHATEADAAWYAALPADPVAATAAFLSRVPAEARERGDAFGRSRYVALALRIAALIASVASIMLMGAATRTRDLARGVSSYLPVQDAIVAVVILATMFLLALPVETYAGFIRYRQAGFSHMTYAQWLQDATLEWAVTTVFYIVGIVLIYALIRRRPASWTGWATVVYAALTIVFVLLSPQYIEPLFNRITPMVNGPQKQAILSLARANGVPADNVFVRDASRQGALLNAHVSGFAGRAQIVLDDNTIATTPQAEVSMVMAHEIGHYVLAHVAKGIVFGTLVTGLGFIFVGWVLARSIARFGPQWDIRSIGDVGALPLFWGLLMLWGFISLPVSNTITREQEAEADLYGLNASREPLGLAEFMIRDADARPLDVSALEEILFFDHPSARNRVYAAMRWRAEHLPAIATDGEVSR